MNNVLEIFLQGIEEKERYLGTDVQGNVDNDPRSSIKRSFICTSCGETKKEWVNIVYHSNDVIRTKCSACRNPPKPLPKKRSPKRSSNKGEGNGSSLLRERDIHWIRLWIKEGYPLVNIAKVFNVSSTTIYKIRVGKAWGHVRTKEGYI